MQNKNVIITIDTEGHVGDDPIRQLIWGETKEGELCGIPLIMDLCDQYEAKALFFVDVAEAWDYGEEKIADVIRTIISRGHYVGVHVHPDHMADPSRLFLAEYSYQEQMDILKKATEFAEAVMGSRPTAFRAGKYGANQDTLNILAELGYKADFSEFYGYDKWCKIQPPVTGDKTVILPNGLVEVPVTSYENYFGNIFHRYDKFDVNGSLAEQKYVLKRLKDYDSINTIVMFLHSFSLLNWRRTPNQPKLSKKNVKIAKKMFQMISDIDELQFCDLDSLLSIEYEQLDMAEVPSVHGIPALYFYFLKGTHVLHTQMDLKRRKL